MDDVVEDNEPTFVRLPGLRKEADVGGQRIAGREVLEGAITINLELRWCGIARITIDDTVGVIGAVLRLRGKGQTEYCDNSEQANAESAHDAIAF